MSDYIKREDAKRAIRRNFHDLETRCFINNVINEVAKVSSDNLVEVVRCKDCVYREVKGEGMTHWFGCRIMEHNDDDWYCSFGERAES